ncbi:MAG: transposase [candidate division Zixibacteria bacterium]|jgi:putative transposase|nr:transposase [candidate division Zixibacteria bacterium]
MTNLRHFDNLGTARFVTFSCFRNYPYLSDSFARDILIRSLDHLRVKRGVRIIAWVLMPDHVHLVLLPSDDTRLGHVIGLLKSWTSQQIMRSPESRIPVLRRNDGSPAVWERRCFDHNCRNELVVRTKVEYCHSNPVRRGLVEHSSEWPWSSYNWYRGEGQILLEIDGM